MRPSRAIGVCLLAGVALAWAGCGNPEPAPRQPMHLRPMAGAGGADVPMYQVRIVRLQHRVRPDAPVEDLWRLLGAAHVPYEKRALWESNDLRLGDGAHLAADRLNELATETPDRVAKVGIITVGENVDFAVPLGGDRDTLDILWTDPSGRLLGRHFDKALAQFHIVCRSDPRDPDAVLLALVPEVLYGAEELHWVRTEAGLAQRMSRFSFLLSDLAAEVRLGPGRLLMLGGPGRAGGADLSLGGALFREQRGPDLWSLTLILTAERLRPGAVPEGESVPFMPSLKSATPAKTAPPAPGADTATQPSP